MIEPPTCWACRWIGSGRFSIEDMISAPCSGCSWDGLSRFRHHPGGTWGLIQGGSGPLWAGGDTDDGREFDRGVDRRAGRALNEVGGLGHWISLQGVRTIAPGRRVHTNGMVREGRGRRASFATPSLSRITVTEITVRKVGSCYLSVVFATQARGGPS
jgi:hypothetical protein